MSIALALWGSLANPVQGEITVFAAASLKTALDSALAAFEEDTGLSVTAAYAGTSVLARQIQMGAPADLFISANPDWMDLLEQEGLLSEGSRRDLLGNRLVVIAPSDTGSPMPLVDLPERLGAGRLAMALVSAVPAGLYGKAALENAEVWERVSPRVVQTDNVRAALALVAIKEAALGIVYATDATPEPRVTIVTDISPDMHPPITYPIARIRTAAEPGADALLAFLTGPEAAPFFTAQGFAVLME